MAHHPCPAPVETIWGVPDTTNQVLPGVWHVKTPSHGGYVLSDERQASMPDALRPLFDQVVIKELDPDRMRKSGLVVPQGSSDMPPNEGIVLAAGDGPPDLPDFRMPVSPGDHVVFPRSAGVWVEIEDERLLVCRVREILGVIESASVPSADLG